jgi:hypothetical protein
VHDQVGIVDSRREPSFRLARRFTLSMGDGQAKKRQLTEGMTEKLGPINSDSLSIKIDLISIFNNATSE